MTAAAANAHAADGFIHPAADRPRPIHIQPAARASDAGISPENGIRWQVEKKRAAFQHHAFFNFERIRFDISHRRDQRIGP